MTIAQCEAKCKELSRCNGITVESRGGGQYECYRKHVNNLGQCDSGTGFDTYTWNNHEDSVMTEVVQEGEKLMDKVLGLLH